jgi:DNA repair protein RadC
MEYQATAHETVGNDQPTESNRCNKPTFVREVTAVYRGPRRATSVMRKPLAAADFVRKLLPDNSREHFVVLHLDGAHQVIGYAVVATGTANSCPVHPREVFQGAILVGAVALIIAHNHPSGDETPSPEDRTLTSRLKDAARLLGMKILDHVIVTDEGFHSLADECGL